MLYAVGDIHGRYDLLLNLMKKIQNHALGFESPHTIVFLGDYIDRGKRSKEVVSYLRNFKIENFTSICLKGNHEDMMEQATDDFYGGTLVWWMQNGGNTTIDSYFANDKSSTEKHDWLSVAQDDLQWFHQLPFYHIEDKYFFVHAGVNPYLPLINQDEENYLWIRDKFLNNKEPYYHLDKEMIIVHGHTPVKVPMIESNHINLDTGAVWTNILTAGVFFPDKVELLQSDFLERDKA